MLKGHHDVNVRRLTSHGQHAGGSAGVLEARPPGPPPSWQYRQPLSRRRMLMFLLLKGKRSEDAEGRSQLKRRK